MKPRKRKCKACKKEYRPFNSLQQACSVNCAREIAQKALSRKERENTRQRKAELKTRSEWLREAQAAVNKYVRMRDKGKPCFTCGHPDDGSRQRHASHYRPVGQNSAVRFNTFNIFAACSICNNWKSGNLVPYRENLIQMFGIERVEWLESQTHNVKYDIEYLKRLKKIFNKRARLAEKRYNERAG